MKEGQTPWVAIGVVARPHGVRGELRVRLHNPESDVLLAVGEVDVEGRGPFAVESARREKDAILLRLRGCATRDQADTLRGLAVRVARSALPPPDADEYYFCDLVGLSAFGADGQRLGEVVDVVEGPGHATLIVRLAAGGEPVDVPLADAFVVSVDVPAGRIVLRGLDDLTL